MPDVDVERQLEGVHEDLRREFSGPLPETLVEETWRSIVDRFAEARVRTFLPVIVRRLTRAKLREAAANS